MRIPNQSLGVNRMFYSGEKIKTSIMPALRIKLDTAPTCSCIKSGDGPFECCKIGTDDCRTCVGETNKTCCGNIGKPSPLPIPILNTVSVDWV